MSTNPVTGPSTLAANDDDQAKAARDALPMSRAKLDEELKSIIADVLGYFVE